jgi:hypothetical protein
MTDQELSQAVVAFLQKGQAASPRTDDAAVRAVATATPPDVLVAKVRSIVTESLDVQVDWGSLTLGDAGRAAAAETGRRHAELDQAALDALAWNFSFTWR